MLFRFLFFVVVVVVVYLLLFELKNVYSDTHSTIRTGEWQKHFHPADFWKQDYFFFGLSISNKLSHKKTKFFQISFLTIYIFCLHKRIFEPKKHLSFLFEFFSFSFFQFLSSVFLRRLLWIFLGFPTQRVYHETLQNFVLNSVFNLFSNYLWNNDKTIKTPGFYYNAHLHNLLKTNVSLLTEIQYLQTEPCEKVTHTNESMML